MAGAVVPDAGIHVQPPNAATAVGASPAGQPPTNYRRGRAGGVREGAMKKTGLTVSSYVVVDSPSIPWEDRLSRLPERCEMC